MAFPSFLIQSKLPKYTYKVWINTIRYSYVSFFYSPFCLLCLYVRMSYSCYLGNNPHVQISFVIASFLLIIFGAGSALQSWQWWPYCPSSHGRACWVLCRSLCKPETRRRCSCSGASSPWTCTRHGRLSGEDREADSTHFNELLKKETVEALMAEH